MSVFLPQTSGLQLRAAQSSRTMFMFMFAACKISSTSKSHNSNFNWGAFNVIFNLVYLFNKIQLRGLETKDHSQYGYPEL